MTQIAFKPPYAKEPKAARCTIRTTRLAWQFAKAALWPHKQYSLDEELLVGDAIKQFLKEGGYTEERCTQFCERMLFASVRYQIMSTETPEHPVLWFSPQCEKGFTENTELWDMLEAGKKQGKECLYHLLRLSKHYGRYLHGATKGRLDKCGSQLFQFQYREASVLPHFHAITTHYYFINIMRDICNSSSKMAS